MSGTFSHALEVACELTRRGVKIDVVGEGDARKLALLPKGAAGDILGEVARFKPGLLELLEPRAFVDEEVVPVDETTPEPFALDAARYGDSISRTVSNRRFVALQILACVETHPNGSQWLRPSQWLSNLWRAAISIEGRKLDSRALVSWARATLEQTAEAQSDAAPEVNR